MRRVSFAAGDAGFAKSVKHVNDVKTRERHCALPVPCVLIMGTVSGSPPPEPSYAVLFCCVRRYGSPINT